MNSFERLLGGRSFSSDIRAGEKLGALAPEAHIATELDCR